MKHSLLIALSLVGAAHSAFAQAPAQEPRAANRAATAAAPSTLRAPDDPTVSPPLVVDPASLKDLHQHALVQTKVGFYAVLLPPDYEAPKNRARRYPVVVILHGGASSEVRHGSLADKLGRNDVIYVVPRAAYPNEAVILNERRLAWSAVPSYPATWGNKEAPSFPAAEIEALDVQGLQLAWIEQVLGDARERYRISADRALLFGHSQGGQFAHLFALRRPELVKAYFAYAGLFDVTTKTPDDARTAAIFKQHGIRPVLVHHQNDERVPVQQTRELAAYFARHGVAHDAQILPGGDHMLDSQVHTAARRFIDAQTKRSGQPVTTARR